MAMVTQEVRTAQCVGGALVSPATVRVCSRSSRHFDAISGRRMRWLVVVHPDVHVLLPHVASVVTISMLKQHQPVVPQVYHSDVYD